MSIARGISLIIDRCLWFWWNDPLFLLFIFWKGVRIHERNQVRQFHLAVVKKWLARLVVLHNQTWPLFNIKLCNHVAGDWRLNVDKRKADSVAEIGSQSFVDWWHFLFGWKEIDLWDAFFVSKLLRILHLRQSLRVVGNVVCYPIFDIGVWNRVWRPRNCLHGHLLARIRIQFNLCRLIQGEKRLEFFRITDVLEVDLGVSFWTFNGTIKHVGVQVATLQICENLQE